MKQLTIAIPSYNAESFLEKCLDSMCGIDARLEVIVINDGSTDRTGEIAHDYEARYPGDVRVIDKENAGHGSGVNAGIDMASGRYFKVVDADDWITSENLTKILDELEQADADAVIMGFKTVNIMSGVIHIYRPVSSVNGRQIDMIKLNDKFDDVNQCLEFHGLCYNTEFLRATGLRMSEHTFYEDLEYTILPFVYAETIIVLPDTLYEYRIGDAAQSTSFANQAKHADNQINVIKRIVQAYTDCKPMGQARDQFLSRRIVRAVGSCYATLLVKEPDKKAGREKAAQFRAYLQESEPALVKLSDQRYFFFRRLGRFRILPRVYGKLSDSRSYVKFKKLWIK